MVAEPKVGCDVMCEANGPFGVGREIRVYTVKRLRFRTDWTVSEGNAFIADFTTWDGFILFLKNVRAKDIEVSEHSA